MADHIPTVRQRRLAQALRELRHEAGLTQDAVAARMGWHTSKLFRLENARSPRVDWLDVRELMDMYGVPSPHREALIQLARDARMMGWWTPYRDVFTGSYVALEDEASAMRLYYPELIPGLLQTEHYARAVIRAVRPGYDEESVERRVAARLARQKALLDRAASPELRCVLNEAVLRRQVGDQHVMGTQLRALADAAIQRRGARRAGGRLRADRVPQNAGSRCRLRRGHHGRPLPGKRGGGKAVSVGI